MEAKKPRGRPKLPWKPFEDELYRRLRAGKALPTVEAEAEELARWASEQGLAVSGGAPLQKERIRERIKKRCGGTQGYNNMRAHHLSLIKAPEGG